jgi:restriction system protein
MLDIGTRTVFADRLEWARKYLKEAGLIDYPKREFTRITEEGKKRTGR